MKKTLRSLLGVVLLIIMISVSTPAKSQQSLIQVNGWNAYVHLPWDYSTSKTYPTIIFFPGTGEVGTNASLVIANGPGAYITQGWNGNIGIGTDTAKFIVISLQPPASYPAEVTMNTEIQSLKSLYKIDPKKLYLTGLSEGGWCASTFVTGDPLGGPYTYASQVAAIVTIEGVKPDDNQPYPTLFQNFAKAGGKDLCFEQSQDGRDGPTVVNELNSTVANSAQFIETSFGSGGHCCWSSYYGGGGTTPGVFTLGGISQNLYQWLARLAIGTQTSTVPVISSSASATAKVGTAFSYTTTASNSPTSYNASGLPSGLSINTSTGVISGTPTTAGTSTVTLSAINTSGTGTQTLTITVNPATPVISSSATATGTVGTAFSYTITASNSPTSYNATGLPAGLSINTSTGAINGTPTTAGTYTVTLSAINAGGTGTKTLTVTINPALPVISSSTSATGNNGTAFSYTITASNNPTSYSATGLPTGLSVNTSTGVISGTPTTAATSSVTIGATNVTGTGIKTLTITITPAVPVISSSATATGTVGTAFSYTITASNSPTRYNATGLPAGLSINTSTGVISGTPTTTTTSTVTLSAINAGGTGTKTLTITVNPAAPVISSSATATGNVGTAFSYTISASNSPTSYNATGLPAGLSVNTSAGVITGTPTAAATSSVTISATNVTGTGTKTLTITINPATPVISSSTTATGTVGTAFSYTITASNSPTSYNATGLPTGLSINTSTGAISGTPTAATTSTVILSATNAGGTGTKTLTITVNPAAPVISSSITATGNVGTAFSYTITASNSPASYNATGLPAGLSVNTATGVISGTPTTAATSSITISATNVTGTGSKTLTITINPAVPAISSSATATGSVGAAFSYTITASNSPTSYNAAGLPAGLSVNTSTGVISGTPTTAVTSTVTLSAINAGGTGSKTLTITVNLAAPVISSSTTATGSVGKAFSYTITASNSPISYNATGLPTGLNINTSTGVISGTPTTAATTSVTISATNAGGTGSKTLSITINPNVPPIANAGADQAIQLPTNSITLSGSGTDADGTIASYQWTQASGPSSSTITNATSASATAGSLQQGTYKFVLKVTDNNNASATDTMQVVVSAAAINPNKAPVANAGVDLEITLPTNSTKLTGSGTDADGTIAGYQWAQLSGPSTATLTNATTNTATASSLIQGVYKFTLTVTDNLGATGKDTVQVTVNGSGTNLAPVANAGNHNNFTWALTTDKSVVVSGPATAGLMVPGASFTAQGAHNTDGYKCAIASGNWPNLPTDGDNIDFPVTPNSIDNLTITGLTFTAKISGSSGNNIFSLAYQQDGTGSWIPFGTPQTALSGGTRSIDFGALSQSLPKGHTYVIRLYTYSSITTTTSSRNVYIKNVVFVGKSALQISLPTSSVSLSGSGTDADGTVSSYLWTKISGPATGSITNATSASASAVNLVQGVYQFVLTVTDNAGATGKDTIQVTVNPVGSRPQLSSLDENISTYPNPAVTNLTTELNSASIGKNARIILTDMNGSAVFTKQMIIDQNKTIIPISVATLPNGIYVLNINIDGKNFTKKIIKNSGR